MTKRFRLMFFVACLLSTNALALTPPYGEEMLKQEADLIVKGEVGDTIKKEGVVEKNKCADTVKYVAPLKVVEVCKGKADKGSVLPVVIYYKNYKAGCVGDQDASYHPGEKGLFYLKQGGQEGTWRPVHWDSVVPLGKDGSFPKCP